ncbi:hypothetical protein ABT297_34515 [Dactylosporangium sp. NPDC000555]|uniref:hypothetical protein n=1 Tax=Dactylosporangium sp. NPDC000555 TaxID=3154260 RepID=UPI00332DE6E7
MRRVMRVLRLVLAALVTVCALGGLARLHSPTLGPGGAAVRQLGFLRAELDDGAGDAAQAMFPEGYFFPHALYGLAWVDVGRHRADRAEALREVRWALSRLDGPQGTAPFSAGLAPRHGVFYAGWTNWLRGGMLSLQDTAARDPAEVERFERDSRDLAAAFDASATPFLQAYPDQSWPVDSTVAIASLRLHDALLPARYGDTVRRWLDGARERLDPATGLLPHVTDPRTGTPLRVPGPPRRASSSASSPMSTRCSPGSSTCASGSCSWCGRWGSGRRCANTRGAPTGPATSTAGRCRSASRCRRRW